MATEVTRWAGQSGTATNGYGNSANPVPVDISWDFVASVATPVGLIATVYQLQQARLALRDSFERTFVDRYQRIVAQIDLNVMLGRNIANLEEPVARRAFFDYFELCEEELYFRAHGKIGSGTWRDWWYGMAINLRSPSFEKAYSELVLARHSDGVHSGPDRFSLLRVAFDHRNEPATFEPTRRRATSMPGREHAGLPQVSR